MQLEVCAYCRNEVPAEPFCAECGAPLVSNRKNLEGRELQSYRIGCLIGEGASGRLYQANHIATNRQVALKLLQPELAINPKSIRRFRREAEIGIRLQHPNAVKLFEFGIDQENGIFMVMELIIGKSLQDQLKEKERFPPERAIAMALEICDVLEKAHFLQIIHRDLKPANILMQSCPGSEDIVKVCDFGLAKMETPHTDETQLTMQGTVYGTPGYMAPEQALGEDVDFRTDIYSFGVVLYELLSGRLPFSGSTPLELLMRPLQTEPLPLRRAHSSLKEYAHIDALEKVVMRCLSRSPAERYGSYHILKADLQLSLPPQFQTVVNLTPIGTLPLVLAPPMAFPWQPIRLTQEQLDYCRELMFAAPTQTWMPAQAIYQKDQMSTRFFLIKSGSVRILSEDEDSIVELDQLGAGDFVGVGSFFSQSPYTITAEASTFAEIHIIDRSTFMAWVQEDSRLQSLFHHFFHEFLQQEVMRYSSFFAPIPPAQRNEFIQSCELEPVGRGKLILEQGQEGKALYIIASGQVEVYWPNNDIGSVPNNCFLAGGDFFGELSLLNNSPVSASIRAVSNVILLRLPKDKLLQLTNHYPAIRKLISQVADKRTKENEYASLDDQSAVIFGE